MHLTPQVRPNQLTHWAARNVPFAVTVIVLLELAKFGIGFYLGKNAFPILGSSSLTMLSLMVGSTAFVTQRYFSQRINTSPKSGKFALQFKGNLILLTTSLLLSILVGNQWSQIHNPTIKSDVSATLIEDPKKEINADSLFKVIEQEQRTEQAELQPQVKTESHQKKSSDGLQRLGYFGLFALAMLLTFIGLYAFCALACSGYGVIAAVAMLINIGVFGGGIYFLLKVFKNGRIKRWREMDKPRRKKEWKRYLLTTLISLGTVIGFVLIANLLG
jgi:uncharacterized membrane-anchored protein